MEAVVEAGKYRKIPYDDQDRLITDQFRIQAPTNLMVLSFLKTGKTMSMMNVPGLIIADLDEEVEGFESCYNYVKAKIPSGSKEYYQISSGAYIPAGIYETVTDLDRLNGMKAFKALKAKLNQRRTVRDKQAIFNDVLAHLRGMPSPILSIDNVTGLQLLNYKAALAEYNARFKKNKVDIKKVDEFGGVMFIRANFFGIIDFLMDNGAPFKIWPAHIREKRKLLEKKPDDLLAVDIALDGILPTTFTSRLDSICICTRTAEGVFFDFTKKEETDIGSRYPHLANRVIKIADPQVDPYVLPVTHWKEIYPVLNF